MAKSPPTEEEFRQAGFTFAAGELPRDELSIILLCAFNGIDPSIAPEAWKYFPNKSTKAAWERVADAARKYLEDK